MNRVGNHRPVSVHIAVKLRDFIEKIIENIVDIVAAEHAMAFRPDPTEIPANLGAKSNFPELILHVGLCIQIMGDHKAGPIR